jgi:hypothetical protein
MFNLPVATLALLLSASGAQAAISTTARCGASFKGLTCAGSTFGDCCSSKSWWYAVIKYHCLKNADKILVVQPLVTAEPVASPSTATAAPLLRLASLSPRTHDVVLRLADRRAKVASMVTAVRNMGKAYPNPSSSYQCLQRLGTVEALTATALPLHARKTSVPATVAAHSLLPFNQLSAPLSYPHALLPPYLRPALPPQSH